MTPKQTFMYGIASYLLFLFTLLYLVFFTGELWVPWTAGSGVSANPWQDAAFNFMLISIFGLQHSVMARESFKKWWTQHVPEHLERSHYVMISTVVMLVLLVAWRPNGTVLWHFEHPWIAKPLWTLFTLGWLLAAFATFLTDHFDLFGLRQVYLHYVEQSYTRVEFSQHAVYKLVRHPMMLGMLIGFWVTPYMTVGHLVLALGFTVYILIGIYFEERSLLKSLGEDYRMYRERTPKLMPRFKKT